MGKKIMILVSIFMTLIVITACSINKKEYNEYTDAYITFNYPADWDLQVNEFQNNKDIFFGENADFQFVIKVEAIKEMKSNDKIKEDIEKELSGGYELADEMISVETISYQETSIGGEWAKELKLEINLVDSEIEQIYRLLDGEFLYSNEVKAYLEQYIGVEDFINEMKYNPEKLVELKTILPELGVESEEVRRYTMLANARIDNISYFLQEENDALFTQYTIISHKENVRLNIFFQSHIEKYIERIETIEQIVKSVTFIDNV